MADTQENVILAFGETGASIVGEKVRSVTRDVQKMKDLFEQAFTKGNNVGAGGSGSIFDPTVVKNFGAEVDKSAGKVQSFTSVMNALRTAFVVREVIKLGSDLIDLSDTYTDLENKIRGVSDSLGQQQIVTQDVVSIAIKSRSSLEDVGTTYVRMTRALDDFGKTQQGTLQFTENLSKAVLIGGSTMEKASGAINQLAVGMESGAIKSRELRSIMLQLPEVANLIADHMGITVAQLKQFAKEGKITTDVIFDAVTEGTARIDEKLSHTTPTFSQGWKQMSAAAIEASAIIQPLITQWAKGMESFADSIRSIPVVLDVLAKNWDDNSKSGLGKFINNVVELYKKIDAANDLEAQRSAKFLGGATGLTGLGNQISAAEKRKAEGTALMNLDETSVYDPRIYKRPTPEPGKPLPGTTFEELLKRMEDTLSVLSVGVLKINVGPAGITLPSQMTKAQLQLAGPEDEEVAKKTRAIVDQLGKKQPRLTDPQKEQLEDLVRQQVGIIQGKKDQLELEKTINKELDERLKREVALIEADQKKSFELGRHERDNVMKSQEKALRQHDSIALGLNDPNANLHSQILDLENFQKNVRTTPEEIQLAQEAIDRLKESVDPLAVAFKSLGQTMVQGFGDAIAQALVLHKNLGDLMRDLVKMIAMQAISSSIQAGIGGSTGGQDGKGTGIIGLLGGLFTSAAVGSATSGSATSGSATSGSAPVHTGGSSFTVIGTPNFGNPDASGGFGGFPGRASGGYTGDFGVNQPAGVVHGREYVLNAAATSSIGVQALGAMNAGGASAMAPKITINNNAAGEGYVARVESTSPGQIQIMIDKSIHEKAPTVVAGAMADRNSIVSKSMRRNFDMNARNV